MDLGDPADAVRAKAALAKQHAREQQEEARGQRERAAQVRAAEEEAVARARAETNLEGDLVACEHCHTVWRADVIREATRRRAACLICGGALRPATDD